MSSEDTTDSSSATVTAEIFSTQVKGFILKQGIGNFLGIQYATVADRFRPAKAVSAEDYGRQHEVDATRFGPRCPQPRDPLLEARSHLFKGLPPLSDKPDSAADCLTLNVYTPPSVLQRSQLTSSAHVEASGPGLLPVLVWIHGGGNAIGTGNTPHDGNLLVAQASKLGKPFVYVSVNYRVGFHGFLTSEELRDEAKRNGEPLWFNRAWHDQRLGLEWVNKHIRAFGGDPDRVTIGGESAGGFSILAQLRSTLKPLYNQAILASAPNFPLPSAADAQGRFNDLVVKAGLPLSASAEEKLKAVRSISDADLSAAIGPFIFATFDPDWLGKSGEGPRDSHFEADPLPSWLSAVMVGNTSDEIALFRPDWLGWRPERFQQMIRDVVPDVELSQQLLERYSIADDATALRGALELAKDCLFETVPQSFARHATEGSSARINLYHFKQRDEDSRSVFKGYAYHAFDLAYIYRYPCVTESGASSRSTATANKLSDALARFITGEAPWEEFRVAHQVATIGGDVEEGEVLKKLDGVERWNRLYDGGKGRDLMVKILHDMLMHGMG